MKRLFLLLCLLPALALAQGPPLYIVHISPFEDTARWIRELALYKDMGVVGVRTGWGIDKLITSDGKNLSQWGTKPVTGLVPKSIAYYKGAGMGVSIDLYKDPPALLKPFPEVWKPTRAKAVRYVMDQIAAAFPPDKACFSVENEPEPFSRDYLDQDLVDFWKEALDYRDLKYPAYTVFGPTYHGWFGDGNPVPVAVELHRQMTYMERQHARAEYRTLQVRSGLGFNLYVDTTLNVESFAGLKVGSIVWFGQQHYRGQPIANMEAAARPDPTKNRYLSGYHDGMVLRALANQPLRQRTLYTGTGHGLYGYITETGVVDRQKVAGFKAAYR